MLGTGTGDWHWAGGVFSLGEVSLGGINTLCAQGNPLRSRASRLLGGEHALAP